MSCRLLVGIDWSTSSPTVCVLDPKGVILQDELADEHDDLGLSDRALHSPNHAPARAFQ